MRGNGAGNVEVTLGKMLIEKFFCFHVRPFPTLSLALQHSRQVGKSFTAGMCLAKACV
jgi:hypothetical protein